MFVQSQPSKQNQEIIDRIRKMQGEPSDSEKAFEANFTALINGYLESYAAGELALPVNEYTEMYTSQLKYISISKEEIAGRIVGYMAYAAACVDAGVQKLGVIINGQITYTIYVYPDKGAVRLLDTILLVVLGTLNFTVCPKTQGDFTFDDIQLAVIRDDAKTPE